MPPTDVLAVFVKSTQVFDIPSISDHRFVIVASFLFSKPVHPNENFLYERAAAHYV